MAGTRLSWLVWGFFSRTNGEWELEQTRLKPSRLSPTMVMTTFKLEELAARIELHAP